MVDDEPSDPRRGPTDETADAVLTAAFHLLVTEGLAAITPTRLHQETGVARTTIYRHWPEPTAFVADIIAGATRREDTDGYVGELEPDLRTAVATLTFRLTNRPLAALLAALLSADVARPLDDKLVPTYVSGLLAPIAEVLAGAVERHELAAGVDPLSLAAELAGPLLVRSVFLGRPVDPAEVEADVEAFIRRHTA